MGEGWVERADEREGNHKKGTLTWISYLNSLQSLQASIKWQTVQLITFYITFLHDQKQSSISQNIDQMNSRPLNSIIDVDRTTNCCTIVIISIFYLFVVLFVRFR